MGTPMYRNTHTSVDSIMQILYSNRTANTAIDGIDLCVIRVCVHAHAQKTNKMSTFLY